MKILNASKSLVALTSSPNVDKKSMVRWKQAQVHKQRRDRQDKIAALKMEQSLNARVLDILRLLAPLDHPEEKLGLLIQDCHEWSIKFEKDVYTLVLSGRDQRWEEPTPDPFVQQRVQWAQLVEKVLQVCKENGNVSDAFEFAIQTLLIRQKRVDEELVKEETEINKKITSETVKTGFDKTVCFCLPQLVDGNKET